MISVMVHAESPIVRAGLESILRASPGLEVVGSSSAGISLAQQIQELQPDVVLLEWGALDDEPVSEKYLALGEPRAPALVVLADSPQGSWAADALRAGVRGILPRTSTAEEIVAAAVAAAAGLVALHPEVAESLYSFLPLSPPPALPTSPSPALTPREIEVLGMLAEGLGNKTIARRLGISEHTVKFHVSSIFQKLSAGSRTEAVAIGARAGLIML